MAISRRVRSLGFAVLCVVAALGGALAASPTRADIGPFDATTSLRLSATGDTVVHLGPLGSLRLDTHDGPVELTVRAEAVDPGEAQRLIESGVELETVEAEVARDAAQAVRSMAIRAALGALLGATAVALLRGGGRRRLAIAVTSAVLVLAASATTARASWRPDAFAQPTYNGLLEVAPRAIGSLEEVRAQYDAYRSQLTGLIANLSLLYRAASDLPEFAPNENTVRVLHVSDMHLNPQAFDLVEQVATQFRVDVIADTGDINDWGTAVEARFVERIGDLDVPYVYVRGNHDSAATAAAVAEQRNAIVLEDDVREVVGLRFWGVGDPRFTPDKSEEIDIDEQAEVAARFSGRVRRMVADASPVDVALLHDPRMAAALTDEAGVVLAGHTHEASVERLSSENLMFVEGSTGGAGLRTLDDGEPAQLTCTVLYFDRTTRRLWAYDRIVVDGLGRTGARIQRHIVELTDGPEPTRLGRRVVIR